MQVMVTWFVESITAKICALACYLGEFVFGAFFMSYFNYSVSV